MRPVRQLVRFAALAGFAALLAGCETTGPGPTASLLSPMTRTRAAAECWMQTEKSAQAMGLDKRADVVNVCIGKKMRGEPTA